MYLAGTTSIDTTNITINEKCKDIGNYLFSESNILESITIPSSVTSIGSDAFSGCDSLTSVNFVNTGGWWYDYSSTATSGTNISSVDLANPSTALTYLIDTYAVYYWKRNV